VERTDANGRYRANLRRLLDLTGELTTRGEQSWLMLAKSCMEELRSATGLSANLCMPSGKEMVYLMQVLGGEGLAVNSPPGTRRPLHCSAAGKAYLGSLPEPELDVLLEALEMHPFTSRTITSAAVLKEHLRKARPHGYCIDDREFDPHIRCVAAPILDSFGRPIGSIGVSGPSTEPAFEQTAELGILIANKANRISLVLGYDAHRSEHPDPNSSPATRTRGHRPR
jgi:IclR family acetate operon transcriptional repressor